MARELSSTAISYHVLEEENFLATPDIDACTEETGDICP